MRIGAQVQRGCGRLGLIVAAAWSLATGVCGQDVRLTLETEHALLMQFEPVQVYLTVHNDTDEPFLVDWVAADGPVSTIQFDIVQPPDVHVPKIRRMPVVKRLRLASDAKEKLLLTLSSTYDMSATGSYVITAIANGNGLESRSNPVHVEVSRGLPILSVTGRVPLYPERSRDYELRYLAREGKEWLFLTVNEPDGSNYGAFFLGRVVRVFKPTLTVSRQGIVTVKSQVSQNRFVVSTLLSSADQVILSDQRYENPDGTPYVFPPDESETEQLLKAPEQTPKAEDKKSAPEKNLSVDPGQ